MFGLHKMPRIVPAKEDAVILYDEVMTTLPHSELAVQSMMGKGIVQTELEEFKSAVESLQLLIRRFPKHELAAESFLQINQVYLTQCQVEHLDLDLLILAEMNLRKFHLAFPREPRLADAEKIYAEMRELYAGNLLDTGRYFEKTKKTSAAIIYYTKVMAKYSGTEASEQARVKLEQMQADGLL